jgi:tetratricopeptide (TPR) repeat protein
MPHSLSVAALTLIFCVVGGETAMAQCQPAVQRLIADRRFDDAKTQMKAVVAKTPNDDAAIHCLGRISSAMDRHKEALEYYEKAAKVNDKVALHHLWIGSSLGDLADSTSKIKQPFLARRIKGEFEKTVALDPSSIEGRLGLVEFYTQAPGVMGGSKEKAQEQLREVIKLHPMRGHLKQADLFARDKNLAEAEKAYIAAEKAAGDSSIAGYTLASFYENQQRWTDAMAVFDRMEKRFPSEWLVRFRIGRAAALSGERMERGAQELRALIASPPPDMLKSTLAGAHHRLGMILEKQGKKDEARAAYNQALAIDPTNENAKKSLAALK